jgi:hypothetical protein
MNCTATDPSPTPEATRFTEPCRTSPTAKMPGIPRLHEEVIDVGLIDGADCSVRVGIGSKQCPLGMGKYLLCLLQKPDPIHVWHPLVRQKKGHTIVAHLQLFQKFQCPAGESLPITRYSAPYCDRRSRSIARKTSESSSTLNRIGFAMIALGLDEEGGSFRHPIEPEQPY